MLRRIDLESAPRSVLGAREAAQSEPVVPAVAQVEHETPLLPQDHPPWVKDALTVSQRAKEIIARLRPIAIRVLTFWEHRVRKDLHIAGERINLTFRQQPD